MAPNLTQLVGELVGARLIAHAGSVMNLAKAPASTIQIFGAEKALFRALKTKHDTPKYGLIFHASLVGQASGKNKGKIARMLATKTTLGLRVDALSDWGTAGEGAAKDEPTEEEKSAVGVQARAMLERRLRALEGKPLKSAGVAIGPNGQKIEQGQPQPGKFDLKEALKIFNMPAAYGFLAIEICLGVPLQSVSLFMPQIVGALGYDKIKTNLYTVAPNIVGAVVLLILAFTSDWTRIRFPFIALGFALTFIGFLIFATQDVYNNHVVGYYACFMMTWGTSAPSVLLSTWYNNNIAHEGRRVTLTSIGVPLANLMGVVSSNIFRDEDKPKYIPALATTAAFGATGCLIVLLLGSYMVVDNARRNRRQGVNLTARDVSTEKLRDGPGCPDFRWFL